MPKTEVLLSCEQGSSVPARDIQLALARKAAFETDPKAPHVQGSEVILMARRHRIHSPALRHLYDRYIGDDPKGRAVYDEELLNAQIARTLFELRTKAHLAQGELARRVGTTASVISRLEDARYTGHSLSMLRRIATALNLSLQIRFLLPSGSVKRTIPQRPRGRLGTRDRG